jgi:uncharacterized membrane protein
VFAFAITLLVVSLEVPTTFNELIEAMRGFVAFLLCFAFLIWLWHGHYIFFRRYGLRDTHTIFLNAVLLFVILFYVYPLKFLATLLMNQLVYGRVQTVDRAGVVQNMIGPNQAGTLMVIYNVGFIAIFLVFLLLYYHAYKKRHDLEMTSIEIFDTKSEILDRIALIFVGMLSLSFVLIGGEKFSGYAGFTYFLIGPIMTIVGSVRGKQRKKLEIADKQG